MKINLDEIIEEGRLNEAQQRAWDTSHHTAVLERMTQQQISNKKFVNHYVDKRNLAVLSLSMQERFNAIKTALDWYNAPPSKVIKLYREGIEYATQSEQGKDTVKEWLAIYKENQKEDFYLTKKQREKFIAFYRSYVEGEFETQVERLIDEIKGKKSYKYKNEEIDLILLIKANTRLEEFLIIDKKSKAFWAVGQDDILYYFDAEKIDKDPFSFTFHYWTTETIKIHEEIVQDKEMSTNRLFFWTGKKAINQYIRYDNEVMILFAKSYIDRPGVIMGFLRSTLTNVEAQEAQIIQTIKNYTSHTTSYTDNKAGIIFIGYGFSGWKGLSLYNNHWIGQNYKNKEKALYIAQSFETAEEASIAFEKRSVSLIKEGKYMFCSSTFDHSLERLQENVAAK